MSDEIQAPDDGNKPYTRRKLGSIQTVREFIAHIARELDKHWNGRDPETARAMIKAGEVLAGLIRDIEVVELAEKVKLLEAALQQRLMVMPVDTIAQTNGKSRGNGADA